MADLNALFNDPDFLDLPEFEQDSIVAKIQGQQKTNPMQQAGDIIGGGMNRAMRSGPTMDSITAGPGMEFAKGVGTNALSKTGFSKPFAPAVKGIADLVSTALGSKKRLPEEDAHNIVNESAVGAATPQGMILSGVPAKGTDKGITSILRRLAGVDASDIKGSRALSREFGPEFVFSKTKAKPEYVGREIAPKATDLAYDRVSGMDESALREIGISPESAQTAQRLKSKHGISKLPGENDADSLFLQTVHNAPDEAVVIPNKFLETLQEVGGRLTDDQAKTLRAMTTRPQSGTEALMGVQPNLTKNLSKAEYLKLRGIINDYTEGGKNSFAQALKSALDIDAEPSIPGLKEAKGAFQLSREVPKAQNYLDKANLGVQMQSKLETASNPKNTQLRESLQRLLGPQADPLLKDLEAQRLAKEFRSPKQMSVGSNPIIDLLNKLVKPGLRGYEKTRAKLIGKD